MDFPGEKLVTRLWETVAEKGIGGLLRPWQIGREGRTRIQLQREQMLALAQSKRDADDILAGRATLDEHSKLVPTPVPPQLASNAPADTGPQSAGEATRRYLTATVEADAMRREVNTSKALLHAQTALADDPGEPPPNKAEEDWLFRWRDHAGSVSSDELQALWGRVLAGEIKTPGSYSLRTLDFLRNLSQAEAQKIEKLSQFVVDRFVWRDREFLESQGITVGFRLEMEELGILIGGESSTLTITLTSANQRKFFVGLSSNDRVLLLTHDDPKTVVTLPIYPITTLGREVLSLGSFPAHEAYLRRLGDDIKKQGINVLLADTAGPVKDGAISQYTNTRDI